MSENITSYSNSQGIKLLERAVQAFGPIFTMQQLASLPNAQNGPTPRLQTLLSKLARSGWIEILKRGTYAVKSPLYSADIPPFAIASALVQPLAISHWSALAHHELSTQNPVMIQASTPSKVITPEMRKGEAYRPRGRATWRAYGFEFEFIHVRQVAFWGFDLIWVDPWKQVNITDIDRTALDLVARPDIFGGMSAAIEILESSLGKVNINRLVDYALRYGMGSVIKRLGWVLEKLGVKLNDLEQLKDYPVRRYYLLDPGLDGYGSRNARWQVIENLRRID
jgi:predicted transcriptional regulator of viral defense system